VSKGGRFLSEKPEIGAIRCFPVEIEKKKAETILKNHLKCCMIGEG
jgi:hypothetical protein